MSRPHTDVTNAPDEATYFREAVDIIPEAIKEEFTRTPADLAFFGERYADAVKDLLRAEHQRRLIQAKVHLTIREAARAGGSKLTVDDLNASVELDPVYQDAKLAEIEAEAVKVMARIRLDAVTAKLNMCVSLGAHMRAELGPDSLRR